MDTKWCLDQYRELINLLPKSHRNKVSVVIPDAPGNEIRALDVLNTYQAEIVELCDECRVILPIHKTQWGIVNFAQQALRLLGHPRITLGIPCLRTIRVDGKQVEARLSRQECIDLLSIRKPNGRKAWADVHLLGISEANRENSKDIPDCKVYAERVALIKDFGFKGSSDANRAQSVFTNKAGKAAVSKYVSEQERARTIDSKPFMQYRGEQEYDEPTLFEKATNAIYESPMEFIHSWNTNPYRRYDIETSFETDEEAEDYLLNTVLMLPDVTDNLKTIYWKHFHTPSQTPSYTEKRCEILAEAFGGHSQPLQLQLSV